MPPLSAPRLSPYHSTRFFTKKQPLESDAERLGKKKKEGKSFLFLHTSLTSFYGATSPVESE
jgi:hypothetical protein